MKKLILLCLLLVACEDFENCADDPSAFSRDLCWTVQAKESKDVSLCLNIENRNDVCVGYVAAALNKPELCDMHVKFEVPNCHRIFKEELVQTKIDACSKLKDLKQVSCFNDLAVAEDNPNICGYSEEKIICALNFADVKRNPQSILVNTVAGEERNLALSTYVLSSGDVSALSLIDDNRVYDGTLVMLPAMVYVRTGEVPVSEFCDSLKGGYTYQGDEAVEAEVVRNRNLCHISVAAVESSARGEDLCGVRLSLNIESYYGFEEEDKADAVSSCEDLVRKIGAAEMLKGSLDFETRVSLLKEFGIE